MFDDPLLFKPSVLVITLYCADIGFSIKITKNKNKPPVETFYCYKKDEKLFSFIEDEKIPPTLLKLLDESESNLFHQGCVIAEIHNLQDGVSGRMGRILLRPCYEVRHLNYKYIFFHSSLKKTSTNSLLFNLCLVNFYVF